MRRRAQARPPDCPRSKYRRRPAPMSTKLAKSPSVTDAGGRRERCRGRRQTGGRRRPGQEAHHEAVGGRGKATGKRVKGESLDRGPVGRIGGRRAGLSVEPLVGAQAIRDPWPASQCRPENQSRDAGAGRRRRSRPGLPWPRHPGSHGGPDSCAADRWFPAHPYLGSIIQAGK